MPTAPQSPVPLSQATPTRCRSTMLHYVSSSSVIIRSVLRALTTGLVLASVISRWTIAMQHWPVCRRRLWHHYNEFRHSVEWSIFEMSTREPVTPCILQLHWLQVRWRVQFKLYYRVTSGLPGRRPVTPRACGAWRRLIHPLHRAPRDRHCCPTRAGPVPFVKIAPQASARGRDWPVPKSYRPAQASARSPCRQCGGPVPFINRMTLSKLAILHRFLNF